MKVVVTGGGGFLGSHLISALLEQGHTVTTLCRGRYPALEAKGVRIVQGDIADVNVVRDAINNAEYVFHVAAKAGHWGKYKDFYQTNVVGTKNIIEACMNAGVKRLIHTSSPSVVMNNINIHNGDESLPYPNRYASHYQKTKAMAEKLVLNANGVNGLETVAIRPHLILGPGDNNLLPKLIEKSRRGELVQIGDGENRVSVCYVDHAVQAHLLAMHAPSAVGKAYFINETEPVNLWGWLNSMLVRIGAEPIKKKISYPVAYGLGAVLECVYRLYPSLGEPSITRFLAAELSKHHYFCVDNAKKDLGFESTIPWNECEDKIIEFYKDAQSN